MYFTSVTNGSDNDKSALCAKEFPICDRKEAGFSYSFEVLFQIIRTQSISTLYLK